MWATAEHTDERQEKRRKSVYVGDVHAMPSRSMPCHCMWCVEMDSNFTHYLCQCRIIQPTVHFILFGVRADFIQLRFWLCDMSLVYTTHVQFCRARTPLLTSIFPSASCALSICPIRVRCAYMHECVLCEWLLSNSVSVHIFWLVHVSFHIIFCQKRAGRCKIKINFGKKDELRHVVSWSLVPAEYAFPKSRFYLLRFFLIENQQQKNTSEWQRTSN